MSQNEAGPILNGLPTNLPDIDSADDRGGALASLFGTWAIVDEADRQLLVGYIINKFRGDESVLEPGLDELTRRTGLTNFGVLNWLDDVWLDGEDALTIGSRPLTQGVGEALSVAVVRLPRTSNATDVDALAAEPGVQVNVTTSAAECAGADLVILPGSRATTSDLAWLRQRGIDDVLRERAAAGRPILGICGGYQMLTARIEDNGIEGASTDGLGLLSGVVRFGADKVLGRPTGSWRGEPASGYTIHHGVVHRDDEATDFLDGEQRGAVFGTMWHGAFEEDGFRRAWLAEIARFAGVAWQSDPAALGFAHRRELMLDRLADAMAEQLDLDALLGAAKG